MANALDHIYTHKGSGKKEELVMTMEIIMIRLRITRNDAIRTREKEEEELPLLESHPLLASPLFFFSSQKETKR
jgi:hypothetical protein